MGIVGSVASAVAGPIIGAVVGGGGGSSPAPTPSPAAQAATGAANIAGGALSAAEAQQFATQVGQVANPFGQYNAQFGSQLANAQNSGQFSGGMDLTNQDTFTGTNTNQLISSLNGSAIGSQLNNLVSNPSSIYSTPQYQAAFGQGQNAVNATLAAQGLNASGNQLAALQSYGQSFGQNAYNTQVSQLSSLYGQALGANQQYYNQQATNTQTGMANNAQQFNQLAQLSGLSNGSPTAAANAMSNIYGNVNAAYNSVGTGIGQLANGVSGLAGAGNTLAGLSGDTGYTGDFSTGLGTTTTPDYNSGLYGPTGGVGDSGYTYGGDNSWGFTDF